VGLSHSASGQFLATGSFVSSIAGVRVRLATATSLKKGESKSALRASNAPSAAVCADRENRGLAAVLQFRLLMFSNENNQDLVLIPAFQQTSANFNVIFGTDTS
jgi:hypothetical protein